MAAASERRLNELAESAVAAPVQAGAATGGPRRSKVAIVAVIVGVEFAWLAAIAYAVWRLVTSISSPLKSPGSADDRRRGRGGARGENLRAAPSSTEGSQWKCRS